MLESLLKINRLKYWNPFVLKILIIIIAIIIIGIKYFSGSADKLDSPGEKSSSPLAPSTVNSPSNMQISVLKNTELTKPANKNSVEQKIIDLYKSKKFVQALNLAESTLLLKGTSRSTKAWINKQVPTLLLSVGYLYLNQSKCEPALKYLLQSHSLSPSLNSLKGVIYCHRDLGLFNQAQLYLDEASSKGFYDIDLLRLHKEIMETSQKLEETIQYYQNAINYYQSKSDKKIVELLKKETSEIEKKDKESTSQESFRSNNFYIKFNRSIGEDISLSILEFLETTLAEFSQSYAFNFPRVPIEVVLYNYKSFLENNGSAPIWAEGLYDGRLRVPVRANTPVSLNTQFKRILRHELVHALLAEIKQKRSLPTWIEEGLAQDLSCSSNCSPIRGSGASSPFLSIKELEGAFTRLDKKNATRAYTQSLYLFYLIKKEYEPSFNLRLIESIIQSREISSESILNFTTSQKFNTIYRNARQRWLSRTLLNPQPDY
jgi:tetratricopeptide (TPR) repeat protein